MCHAILLTQMYRGGERDWGYQKPFICNDLAPMHAYRYRYTIIECDNNEIPCFFT